MRIALVLLAAAGALVLVALTQRPSSVAWRAVEKLGPVVPTVTPERLAERLAGPDPPVLLDARAPAEYAVSHLPSARRVDPDAPAAELVSALPDGAAVVVYCSVGVRSGLVAERLLAAGVAVENLEGGIFRWANEGRAVVRGGEPVGEVHPYNAKWGRLLRPALRAEL